MSDDRNESEQSGQGAGGEQHPADRASRGDEQSYSAQQHPTQQFPSQQAQPHNAGSQPPQQGYPQQYAGYGQGAYQPASGRTVSRAIRSTPRLNPSTLRRSRIRHRAR